MKIIYVYNDKGFNFGFPFRGYIKTYVYNVGRPALIKDWKLNLDKSAYEKNGRWCCFAVSEEKMQRHISCGFLPSGIRDEVIWFPFQYVIMH